ncbi:Transporter [Roseomonas mucosa]|uniref:Oligopeptide ABC transporter substrate-binding protein n=1 Tax=Roseomonas mucosa TaxID=207340 RepID=A0A1S8D589_9PROT|nr:MULTISPECIES: ABC transporter substrate-binding protein [Roseomonas]MBS5902677.1 ABC transporter substrate-binding protein [Acetobacteraceae bacterium]AWV21914.1 Transporter [Roseomonas mucosa]MCG7351955.1 ABC transporter substrate-binding protein [Roseomonas mucosa]MCG7355629.1 ABC transporter substrate-binding protein [Roseomonas mucosa]MDT8277508.1 ABC transporter substrate-binding protein [Roseomonas mucosa]
MRSTRRHLLGGGLAAVLPGLPAAASAQAAGTDTRPVLRIGVADLPPTLEPAKELSNVGTRITYSVFDTLIRRDFLSSPDGGGARLVPHLATAWRREGDRDLLVTLRPGVRFHNGDTLAAEDVVFTFGRMMGDQPLLVEAKSYFPTLESVTAEGPLAVRFRTRVPDILLEQRLASWCSWIVNKRAYEELGLQGFGQAPVGTGPYRLRSLRRDQAIVLDAFDDYWMGRPTARAVEFRGIPQVAGRTAALLAGDIDLATNIPPDQVEELQGRSGIDLRSVVLANVHVLVFDQRGAGLSDKRVRQALGLAIDRELLVRTLWNGAALVPHSHNFPEYGDMYLPGRSLRYDPDRARALLREAGYDGTEITYRTQANYYTNALPAAQVLVEMWKAVGVNVRLQVVENAAQLRPAAGGQISNWSNSTRLPDPLGAIWIGWGPGSTPQVSKSWTSTAAFNRAGHALEAETDPARRRALFATMLDAWEDEAPGTILYQPAELYAVRSNIRWRPYTFYFMDLRPDNLSFA